MQNMQQSFQNSYNVYLFGPDLHLKAFGVKESMPFGIATKT
jgi:hypothetical protein